MQERSTADHPLQTGQQAIWLLIVLLTPLFVNFWVEQQFEASKIWLLRTLIWILAVLWLGAWLAGQPPNPLPTRIRNLVIILFLILTLSTILSPNPFIALFGSLERANGLLTQFSYLLLFILVATRINAQNSRQLLLVMVLTAVPITLLGLAQAAGWQPLPVSSDARSPLTTTLGRANFTGAYLTLLLPLTLTAAQLAQAKWQRFGFGTLAALELIVIVLTQARGAWIAAVVAVGLLFWLQHAPHWSRRLRWLSGLGSIAVLSGALLLILQQAITSGGSIAARWTIWQASLRLLWSHLWLGYGADTLELHFPSVYPPQLVYYQGRGIVVDRAHNWLLDWSLNYGIVATAVFIILIALILWQGWQRLKAPAPMPAAHTLDPRWLAGCMAAICAQLVGNLFLFDVAATAVVFWLLLAIVTATTNKQDKEPVPLPNLRHAGKVIVVAIVLLVGWAVWQSNLRPLLADMHSWRGTQALNRGDRSAALAAYETAVGYQPKRAAYHGAVALTAAQAGHFEQAETAMQAAIQLRPTDPVLYTQLAAIYGRAASEIPEKIGLAYAAYEQAITLAPTIGLTHQQYADLALRAGNHAAALKQAQQAVDLDATDGIAYGILGWTQLHNGNLTAAQNAFEQAVRWQPDSADFHLGLATVYYQQGNLDAAQQAVQQSLLLDPTYPPTLALQLQLDAK